MSDGRVSTFAVANARPLVERLRSRRDDAPLVAFLGRGFPQELLEACGAVPFEILGGDEEPAAAAAELPSTMPANGTEVDTIVRTALLLASEGVAGLALGPDEPGAQRAFAVLREVARTSGPGRLPPIAFVDQRCLPHRTTTRYNHRRLADLVRWTTDLTRAEFDLRRLNESCTTRREQAELVARFQHERTSGSGWSGTDAWHVVRASRTMSPEEHVEALRRLLAEGAGDEARAGASQLLLSGSRHPTAGIVEQLESSGAVVLAEHHPDDGSHLDPVTPLPDDPLLCFAERPQRSGFDAVTRRGRGRVRAIALAAQQHDVDAVVHLSRPDDESSPWIVPWLADALAGTDVRLVARVLSGDDGVDELLAEVLGNEGQAATPATPIRDAARTDGAAPVAATRTPPAAGRKRRPLLRSGADSAAYQRSWFRQLSDEVEQGSPLAVVGADSPQEIYRALGVPYVVTQWWSSIVAAKQASGRNRRLLEARGYPTSVEPYSAQGLASALEPHPDEAPWGGLPTPRVLQATLGTPATLDLYDVWAGETGADLVAFERSTITSAELPERWWDRLPRQWPELLEPARLDLLHDELVGVVRHLEQLTGRRLEEGRLRRVMDLVNEQAELSRATRDLIAATTPAPVGITDTMPATMVPQWHRGTTWARDAAEALHDEVAQRVERGQAACDDERLRLLWVGRGLWGDLGFYQQFEATHGAVFVWSMYLGLAADGYLRYLEGHDPLRALAARFLTMGDELRLPGWAGPWHVKEAHAHGVHGAVAIDDADPHVVADLRRAGVPTLQLAVDNMAGTNDPAITARMERFLAHLAAEDVADYLAEAREA